MTAKRGVTVLHIRCGSDESTDSSSTESRGEDGDSVLFNPSATPLRGILKTSSSYSVDRDVVTVRSSSRLSAVDGHNISSSVLTRRHTHLEALDAGEYDTCSDIIRYNDDHDGDGEVTTNGTLRRRGSGRQQNGANHSFLRGENGVLHGAVINANGGADSDEDRHTVVSEESYSEEFSFSDESDCTAVEGEAFDAFGKRSSTSSRHCRQNDCLVLQNSEMIAVDYPDLQPSTSDPQGRGSGRGGALNASAGGSGSGPGAGPSSSSMYRKGVANSMCEGYNIRVSTASTASTATSASNASNALDGEGMMDYPAFQGSSTSGASVGGSSTGGHPALRHPSINEHGDNVSQQSLNTPSARSSRSSEASSGVSSWDCNHISSYEHPDLDFSGLPENAVDSDEEDDESVPSGDSCSLWEALQDTVRECLERDPDDRSEDDVCTLLEFMQRMPSFAHLPQTVKRALCGSMVFAVVDKAGTTVMEDGEELDSWCVIVNGEVDVTLPDGTHKEYHLGDWFGVEPRPEKQHHRGTMRTLVPDCNFVLVAQEKYQEIMARIQDNVQRHVDSSGHVILETERRTYDNGAREGYIVMKARPEKLIEQLVEDHDRGVDPSFIEDVLLMHRTFMPNSAAVMDRLLGWFPDPLLRDKVVRVILLWVNNHFNDFETSAEMMKSLEEFEAMLEKENLYEPEKLLNIACSVKSRSKTVTYTRSDREEALHFSVLGGFEKGYGIYVSHVEPRSQADRVGLKRGDQILEVNGNNFQHIPHQKALEILKGSTHLSITVKSNLLGFKEMLNSPDKNDLLRKKRSEVVRVPRESIPAGPTASGTLPVGGAGAPPGAQLPSVLSASSCAGVPGGQLGRHGDGSNKLGRLIKKLAGSRAASASAIQGDDVVDAGTAVAIATRRHIPPGLATADLLASPGSPPLGGHPNHPGTGAGGGSGATRLRPSQSNPDLSGNGSTAGSSSGVTGSIAQYYQPVKSAFPEHVLKIYRANQTFKFLTVYKETTAQNVVQLALQEFNMGTEQSSDYALYEVSVTEQGVIKQKRLPDQLQNLAERISLNSRYYLRNVRSSEPLLLDEQAGEVAREAQTNLLQLSAHILAAQLTLQDFAVFGAIEPTEYVDDVFKLKSAYGCPKLIEFEKIVNRETMWVCTEVCQERTVVKRAKLLKKFIKVAKHCKDFKNMNSMFAVVSGLRKTPVARLGGTWEKVPNRYRKMLDELDRMLDVTRNWCVYRDYLKRLMHYPPAIPIFPLLKKDLSVLHEVKDTWTDTGLVSFDKLREVSREIRNCGNLASVPFELSTMSEIAGSDSAKYSALLHMNSFDGQNVATVRRPNAPRSAPLSRKKLYEQALMVRRVKSYLATLVVVEDEHRLDTMSAELEPPPAPSTSSHGHGHGHHGHGPGGAMAGSATGGMMRRRQPSPSPSSHSGHSSASAPAAGAEGTIAGHAKLMALAESSRIRPASGKPPSSPGSSGPSVSSSTLRHPSLTGTSPGPSPVPPRRGNRLRAYQYPYHAGPHEGGAQPGHGHPGSGPVDLTPESSAVNNLMTAAVRMPSNGSVASADSAFSQLTLAGHPSSGSGPTVTLPNGNMVHATSSDSTDSGHASIDAYSGSANGSSSPPSQRRSYPSQQRDAVTKSGMTRVALPGMSSTPSSGGGGGSTSSGRAKMVRAPVPPPSSTGDGSGARRVLNINSLSGRYPQPQQLGGSRGAVPPSADDEQVSRV